jgi:pyruvate dehydrogenase E1 component beta subunit
MKMSIREAINQTLHQEMARDERVIVLGEDVASDQGGVYGITEGLPAKFGVHRVIDTPITESAIVGAAGGAALTGLRPVAELMFVDFLGVCLDQILNQIAKFRYMFGGQARTPVVIRTMIGAGTGTGPTAFTDFIPAAGRHSRYQGGDTGQCGRCKGAADDRYS